MSSRQNWIRIENVNGLECAEPFGEAIVELFANHDRLASDRSADRMMAWKPRLPSDVRIDQQLHLEGGEWKPSSMQLRRPGTLPSFLALDPQVADFLRPRRALRAAANQNNPTFPPASHDVSPRSHRCLTPVRPIRCRWHQRFPRFSLTS